MESQHQKWVNFSYVVVAALFGWIIYTFGQKITAAYDLEATIHNLDLYIRIFSLGAMGLGFLLLYRNEQTNQFMNEVVTELSRVTWPTQKETSSATFVVIIMVLATSMVLGFFDYLWTQAIHWII